MILVETDTWVESVPHPCHSHAARGCRSVSSLADERERERDGQLLSLPRMTLSSSAWASLTVGKGQPRTRAPQIEGTFLEPQGSEFRSDPPINANRREKNEPCLPRNKARRRFQKMRGSPSSLCKTTFREKDNKTDPGWHTTNAEPAMLAVSWGFSSF